ncbi:MULTISPECIES: YceK/YidQ family lipoprotein [unclassified Pseudomonas]|uniref:YceK/YidQ family lipoprotein n=1 Tax=unclassified Pseudomonas TaxID=196821 RepID=UPI000A1FF7C4|nr:MULTISPECIES: YceK/YidQ family lipoprotein [unclassified Pseudomonas]
MNKLLASVLLMALALQLTGCATARTLDAAKPGAPVVYSGTRLDLYAMNGGCCAMDRFGAEAPGYPSVDLPASALLDTLLLPLSLLTVIGVGFQATGGL